jgi:hypothetical protein
MRLLSGSFLGLCEEQPISGIAQLMVCRTGNVPSLLLFVEDERYRSRPAKIIGNQKMIDSIELIALISADCPYHRQRQRARLIPGKDPSNRAARMPPHTTDISIVRTDTFAQKQRGYAVYIDHTSSPDQLSDEKAVFGNKFWEWLYGKTRQPQRLYSLHVFSFLFCV